MGEGFTADHSVIGVQCCCVYLHCEPHCSGLFDMQLVYEDMPQESSS
jgi:hypothetical protein